MRPHSQGPRSGRAGHPWLTMSHQLLAMMMLAALVCGVCDAAYLHGALPSSSANAARTRSLTMFDDSSSKRVIATGVNIEPAKRELQVMQSRSDGVCLLPPAMTADEIEAIFCKDGVCVLPPPMLRTRTTARDWTPVDKAGRRSGVCTYWDAKRGYGFIAIVHADASAAASQGEAAVQELFVHRSDVQQLDIPYSHRALRVGEELEFGTARNRLDGRLKATDVTAAPEPEGEDPDAIYEKLFGCSLTDFAA